MISPRFMVLGCPGISSNSSEVYDAGMTWKEVFRLQGQSSDTVDEA